MRSFSVAASARRPCVAGSWELPQGPVSQHAREFSAHCVPIPHLTYRLNLAQTAPPCQTWTNFHCCGVPPLAVHWVTAVPCAVVLPLSSTLPLWRQVSL